MRFFPLIILMVICLIPVGCSNETPSSLNPSDVDMIFWEFQSWETGGGKSRLTIWADGRSQVTVVPDAHFRQRKKRLRVRDGWAVENDGKGLYFVRRGAYPEGVAKDKLRQALAAGIHLLKTFKPDYVDGNGVLVGVQIRGELEETIIPMFLDQQKGSENHKRFLAVSKVLSEFDRVPFEVEK